MRDLTALAKDQWELSPENTVHIRPAISLPGQVDRIRAAEFATIDHVVRTLRGRFDVLNAPTRAYRLTDIDLVDGVLYASRAQRHLRPRSRRSPIYRTPRESVSGTLFESWNGNRWFGTWLHEDCLTYRLAEAVGNPVTTAAAGTLTHMPAYEAKLGMTPRRVGSVHFDELILFDDESNNAGKAARAHDMRERLLFGCASAPVPGVFVLRGKTGAQRIMINERDIAERLAIDYGFLILDPMRSSVEEIAAACGRASVVMGIEGSHLVHGAVLMPQDALLFVIQPPDRACVILKALTDRRGQDFAFVVGEGTLQGFVADWTEIRRTLDLSQDSRQSTLLYG